MDFLTVRLKAPLMALQGSALMESLNRCLSQPGR
jgi:hypothetical protein